jgi:hypothetical protein
VGWFGLAFEVSLEDARTTFRYALDLYSRHIAIVRIIDKPRCFDTTAVSLDALASSHLPTYGVRFSASLCREDPTASKAVVVNTTVGTFVKFVGYIIKVAGCAVSSTRVEAAAATILCGGHCSSSGYYGRAAATVGIASAAGSCACFVRDGGRWRAGTGWFGAAG